MQPPAEPDVLTAPHRRPWPARLSKPTTNLLIGGVLLFQLALPLRYYLTADEFDERFAWRMFSPIRVTRCAVSWTEGEARTPIEVGRDIHQVWFNLMRRARMDVVDAFARRRCAAQAVERPAVFVSLTCQHPDGETRTLYPPDRNLCEVGP